MNPEHVIYLLYCIYAFLFGTVIGSFLNVVIYRLPAGRTIAKGHSMCMTCGHNLGPLDLVPLFSWLFLKGKCRYCGAPIASRYAKIESLTGFVFLINALTHLDASLVVVDMSAFFVELFTISVVYSLCYCTLISAMMIWYDTGKSFWGLAILPVAGNLIIALCNCLLLGANPLYMLYNVAYMGLFILIQFLLGNLVSHDYKMVDFKADITVAALLCANCYSQDWTMWYNIWLMPIAVAIFAIVYSLFSNLTKGKKSNKYRVIFAFAVIFIAAVARFFILGYIMK